MSICSPLHNFIKIKKQQQLITEHKVILIIIVEKTKQKQITILDGRISKKKKKKIQKELFTFLLKVQRSSTVYSSIIDQISEFNKWAYSIFLKCIKKKKIIQKNH